MSFYRRALTDQLTAVFVDAPELFDRDGLYGDDRATIPTTPSASRCSAAPRSNTSASAGVRPSVIHAHDWQAGLVPAYQKMLFSPDPVVGGVPVVFTIHNLAFQGVFSADTLNQIALPRGSAPCRGDGVLGPHQLPQGRHQLQRADHHRQPDLRQRDLTPEMGFGFDGILRRRADDLVGILNGIDTERWNPAADLFVPAFTPADLSGKREAKRLLLRTSPGRWRSRRCSGR